MNSRPKLSFASFFALLKQTVTAFGEDRVGRHAAALAYFTIFSLSPMLLVLISIAALYFQDQAQAAGAITSQIEQTIGSPTAAKAIEDMIQSANSNGQNSGKPITATIIALLIALWGASGLFGALQDSLNAIWGVAPKPDLGIMGVIQARFISFAMVLGVGFLLLVSLVLTTALSAVSNVMSERMGDSVLFAQLLSHALALGISLLLFAAIYKVLPDAKIQWRDVWIGAFVTALLFSLGRWLLGWYLGRPEVASAYGSAGALIVLLLWVNYAATILFVGAEFTKAYANKFGSKIEPDDNAIAVSDEARARQGLAPQQSNAGVQKPSSKPEKDEKLTPEVARLREEKIAAFQKSRQQEFEYTLAVVSGGVIAALWFLRRQSRED